MLTPSYLDSVGLCGILERKFIRRTSGPPPREVLIRARNFDLDFPSVTPPLCSQLVLRLDLPELKMPCTLACSRGSDG